MYIIRNALRCIGRSKGRNFLIAIIVLVIAISSCVGLSIRRAAETARTDTLETMTVTATISFDRFSAMQDMKPPTGGEDGEPPSFDRDSFKDMMGSSSALTLEEYQTYAAASSVSDFYYSLTVGVNGDDALSPVENEETSSQNSNFGGFGGPGGGFGGGKDMIRGAQSEFSVIGYSSEKAMTQFADGTASVTQGTVFTEGTAEYQCIITEELATYNDLSVNDTVVLVNPNNEEETYTLTVTGFYTDTSANQNSFSVMGMTSSDPANRIYMSYAALDSIVKASQEVSTTEKDSTTGREFETALSGDLAATYVLPDVEAYETFEKQVFEMGLDESYTVSSSDITAFENGLAPLETLSTTAGYFLAVILIIGAVILVVLNIFNVRERKYEIGVLTAMGMKKGKVALQFLTEIFVVTICAVIIGAGIGAAVSVPVANALLENQTTAQTDRDDRLEENFGRGEIGGMQPPGNMPQGGVPFGDRMEDMFENAGEYMVEIQSATDLTVIGQMLIIAVALTLVGGAASMLFIMRYEPLRILSNRD